MRHKHTSIVYMHLTTRRNNKILHTPLPHNSSSEKILPSLTIVAPLPNSIRTNKSPFLKSYLHKADAKSHPSSLDLLCNTHIYTTHITSSFAQTYAPHGHPWICGQPRRSGCTVGQMVRVTALLARWTEKLAIVISGTIYLMYIWVF